MAAGTIADEDEGTVLDALLTAETAGISVAGWARMISMLLDGLIVLLMDLERWWVGNAKDTFSNSEW